jgi:hypothetical protein
MTHAKHVSSIKRSPHPPDMNYLLDVSTNLNLRSSEDHKAEAFKLMTFLSREPSYNLASIVCNNLWQHTKLFTRTELNELGPQMLRVVWREDTGTSHAYSMSVDDDDPADAYMDPKERSAAHDDWGEMANKEEAATQAKQSSNEDGKLDSMLSAIAGMKAQMTQMVGIVQSLDDKHSDLLGGLKRLETALPLLRQAPVSTMMVASSRKPFEGL